MDTNFCLKNRLNLNLSMDPGLWNGMAYMALRGPYEDYVLSQADEEDVCIYFSPSSPSLTLKISQISTCVGFQALAKATTQNTRGLRYTGVGAAMCGRSEMVLPNSVANLQKGERYVFVAFSRFKYGLLNNRQICQHGLRLRVGHQVYEAVAGRNQLRYRLSMVYKYIPTDGTLAEGPAASGGSEFKTFNPQISRACSFREGS